mgnify:CR=1 FL=1
MSKKNLNHRIGYIIEGKNSKFNLNQERMPRHDEASSINLATPYKIKRILRDYWEMLSYNIFVSSEFVNPKDAFKYFLKINNIKNIEKKDGKYVITKEIYEKLIEFFIDIRYFGGVFKSFAHKNSFKNSLKGCVQFSSGRTINKTVIYNDSKNRRKEDWKTKYELFQYNGSFSSSQTNKSYILRKDGDDSRLITEKDINNFFNDMNQALKNYSDSCKWVNPTGSIKNIFFIDIIIYKETGFPSFMNSLDIEYLVDSYEDVESTSDFYILLDNLKKVLLAYKECIVDIKVTHNGTLKFKLDDNEITIEAFIENILNAT